MKTQTLEEFMNEKEAPGTEKPAKKSSTDKVLIRIPLDQTNKDNVDVPVCINGVITQIKRGEDIYVTQQIREILINAKYI